MTTVPILVRCAVRRTVLIHKKQASTLIDEWPKLPALASRADAGCGLCQAIRAALDTFEDLPVSTEAVEIKIELTWETSTRVPKLTEFDLERDPSHDGDRILSHLRIMVNPSSKYVGDFYQQPAWDREPCYLRVCADEESSIAKYLNIKHRIPLSDPISDTGITLMKRWIEECCNGHESICSKGAISDKWMLPSRLIDVGRSKQFDDIRVIEQNADALSKYVALSYCWGKEGNPLRATKSSLSQLQQQITWQTIPKTIQDAIIVVRRMGYSYLWVDALCIIQDDDGDFRRELNKMAGIYSHAHFTIAAVGAESSEQGFLPERRNVRVFSVQFQSKRMTSMQGKISLIEHTAFEPPTMQNEYLKEVEDSKWNSRGWTLQERHLARRIIFFGQHSLHYLCGEMLCSELHTVRFIPRHWLPNDESSRFAVRENDGYLQWYKIASQYSSRKLTHRSDKSLAIRSMASALESNPYLVMRGYTHGLWDEDLHRGLLWYPFKQYGSCGDFSPIKRPSWSWIGQEEPVGWRFLDAVQNMSELSLRCMVVDTWYQERSQLDDPLVTLTLEGRVGAIQNPKHDRSSLRGALKLRYVGQIIDVCISYDTDRMIGEAEVWLLLLGDLPSNDDQESVCGLALRQLEQDPIRDEFLNLHGYQKTNAYERVGTFEASSVPWEHEDHETWEERDRLQTIGSTHLPSIKAWLQEWPRELVHLV
ncbi:heterokaryon incompatibility protein-domain-containing protein [Lophiotrema nucula]|uniref:Heterokaryon incompatibility protein-domain-containing protein n=1 Tax=Lophiotrema nucula TaxID=690887 RepID=A0A6A5ZA82_9PLEO|nr:heterokaryon incompatibility protein-domain-containing protein [Lophiotrema nucula]